MKFLFRFIFARRLTMDERRVFDAASKLAYARAEHRPTKTASRDLMLAWSNLQATKREAEQLGLFDKTEARA